MHPLDGADYEKIAKKTLQGHTNSHIWNGMVRRRIHSYRPEIIAIDGLEPVGIDEGGGVDLKQKTWVWNLMPGSPSQLNGKDEILVLAGDNTYGETDPNKTLASEVRILSYIATIGVTAGLAKLAHDYLVKHRTVPPQPEVYDWDQAEEQEKLAEAAEYARMSRRRFLGLAAGSVAFLSLNSNQMAAVAPWEFSKNAAVDTYNIANTVSLDRIANVDHIYDYMEGRTALLAAKTKEMLNSLGIKDRQQGGAIVMGNAHSFEADNILSSYHKRQTCIRRLTELMLAKAQTDTKEFTGKWTPKTRRQWVIDNQAAIQIYSVKEPDKKRFKADPKKEINRIVKLEDTLTSYAVKDAIEGLAA